jgi:hypothetical protein
MAKSQGMLEQLALPKEGMQNSPLSFFKPLMWRSVPEEDYYNTKET